jgi:hypothetical protein
MQGGVYTVVIQLPFDGSTNAEDIVILLWISKKIR